jgi:hypothetical protein
MPTRKIAKRHTVVPTGASDDGSTTDTEDEMKKVQKKLQHPLVISDESSSDEENQKESLRKPKMKKEIHWSKKPFVPPVANFAGSFPPPPNAHELEPINYFYLMFGEDSIKMLKDQSNLYSVQSDQNRPLRLTDAEIRQFLGILIMTGIYSFPKHRYFWANTTRVDSIVSVMSRDRFLLIKKNLHVVDNSFQLNPNDPAYDRAFKVRPLLNIVKENFRKIQKEEKLSADEQIIPFKGRSIMKQHMPNKPNRWGYKVFVLAGGESGICYDFVLYTGKGDKVEHGFCTDIIITLCETVPRSNDHQLFCDNFFTTIQLQVELMKLGIFCVGTIRSNRLAGLSMRDANDLSREGRGSMDHRVTEVNGVQMCATRWFDNNVVNCLSTLHDCELVDSVRRWSTKEKKHIQIQRPNVIKAYNQYMGGVDLIDMLIALYRIKVRSRKYYMKIIFHLIDLSIVTAWLLYRRHCTQLQVGKKDIFTLLEFRIEIATVLLRRIEPQCTKQRGRPSLQELSVSIESSRTRRALTVRHPRSDDRKDGSNHWPSSTTKGRCRYRGCTGYSTVLSSKCKVRLCLNNHNNCYRQYHK